MTDADVPASCCRFPVVPVVSLGTIEVAVGVSRPIVVINEEFLDPDPSFGIGDRAPIVVDLNSGEVDLGPIGAVITYE